MFPLIASCTLFGIYVVFQVCFLNTLLVRIKFFLKIDQKNLKIFSKDHINLLLAFYFFMLGVIALTRMSR